MKKTLLILGSVLLSGIFAVLLGGLMHISPLVLFVLFNIIGFLPMPKGSLNTVTQNTLIGQSRQKIGNAVFSTWKGINVLKSKPMSVANPKTDAQLQQRYAFAQMVSAFRQAPAVIRAGFKKQAIRMSEFNAFMSANLDNAFDRSVPGVATIVPADVVGSKGTIAVTSVTLAGSSAAAHTVHITWAHTNLQPGQSLTDKFGLLVYNHTREEWSGAATNTQRSADTATVSVNPTWAAGDTLHTYSFFYNELSGESSDSDHDTQAMGA